MMRKTVSRLLALVLVLCMVVMCVPVRAQATVNLTRPENITDDLDDNQFIWTRVSEDAEADKVWNEQHFGGTKSIEITTADVNVRATFFCDLIDTTTRASLLG